MGIDFEEASKIDLSHELAIIINIHVNTYCWGKSQPEHMESIYLKGFW